MLRQLAFIAILLFASSYGFKFTDIPEEFREMMPPELKAFLTGLSDADKAILKEVMKSKSSFQSEDEIVAAIKAKSADLGARVDKIHSLWKEKIAALGPEAQAFAKESMKRGLEIRTKYFADSNPNKAVLKQAALAVIKKFRALSDEAKADYKKQFPIIGGFLSNDKTVQRLESLN
ncbi:nematode fatty acid retinoid binding protein [Oesophagostomum dentatum]|uniref:Fatty-acid and retinol-binding protein 1 n=1 Tax=Oesophagostomum dentatum TaxID=61180 RepID=A0A0B1T7D1_OESDE|nr:nematode fatty acid retinoid binding protein [Oesophagostomum dentatum]